jgi:peptidoglycan/xylan/chitin deacetylase (PgdA/CDA1 family)/glycosyltransferase involved in cell wall biosynthesis
VVEQPNAGAARARNRGAALGRGEFLLFLDDDMLAAPDLLEQLGRLHLGGADAVLGHIPVAPGSPASFLSRGLEEWAASRLQRLRDASAQLTAGDLLTGQLSVRRSVFEALGGFDERFTAGGAFGGEDTDFGRRLFAAGYRVEFAPQAISYQHYVVTPREYLRQYHDAGAADVTYLRKHPADFDDIYAAARPRKRTNRLFVRPVARIPGARNVVAAAVRGAALALATRWPEDPRTRRLFFVARNLEYWCGVEEAGGLPRAAAFRVLCYHAIADLTGTMLADYGIPAPTLRRQLRLLRRLGFRFITLEEALGAVRGERGLPRSAVLLTFDDCYTDLLEAGLPVLEELAAPAAAFAVAGRVGATNTWDVAIGAPERELLDARGLRTLERKGVEIGVHGCTHRPLTGLSADAEALAEETVGATEALRGLGLHPLRTFAYPHGEHDAAARDAVARAGLAAAFTVTAGVARPGEDPYQLPRIEVLRRDGAGLGFLLEVLSAGRLPRVEPRRAWRRVWRRVRRRSGRRERATVG